jgi:hypothetical protein
MTLRDLAVNVCEPSERQEKHKVACVLGKNIRFDMEALESFSSVKWSPVIYDALVVAAAIEFCDRSLARSKIAWGRRLAVQVPVHDPHLWSDKATVNALTDALNLLTGDDWHFEFRARKAPALPPAQSHMRFSSDVEAVIAFSDGMDSRAVYGLERQRLSHRLVRVRVGTTQQDVSQKERDRAPFTALPYRVQLDDKRNAENSARSRGFKFGMVSAIAAYLVDAPYAIVPESGQGALAPVILPVGQGYEDYRNHPLFTRSMERLVDKLFGHRLQYQFPRLWTTKGETLREFVNTCNDGLWVKTRSCWQQSRQSAVSGVRRQCGVCAACILRRLSVHAAGLAEPPQNYVWESLQTSTWEDGAARGFKSFTPALREYAIAGVLHFEHLASIKKFGQYDLIKRRKVSELARSLPLEAEVITSNLDRLLQQHTIEWSAFINNLGARSFVRKWIDNAS